MNKPTEEYEWAEDPNAEVDEPDTERAEGWQFQGVPPAEQKNWLQRMVGRWLGWFEFFTENHVHDGGDDPESVEKIDLAEHIDWGEYGYLEVFADQDEFHILQHQGSADDLVIATDRLRSKSFVPNDPDGRFRLTGADGSDASGKFEIDYIYTDQGEVEFLDDDEEDNVNVKAESFEASGSVEASNVDTEDVQTDTVEATDRADAPHLPKAWGVIEADGDSSGSQHDLLAGSGLGDGVYEKHQAGEYSVFTTDSDASPDAASDVGVEAALNEQVQGWEIYTEVLSASETKIYVYDDQGDLADARCTVSFFWT